MTTDIFKLFKKSIEQITVKKTERGTFDGATTYSREVDAIIKRRDGMTEAIENSEDRNTQTTIHFRASDKQYIEEGNFVQIDGKWRSISGIKDGKNFHTGKTEFILVAVGDDIKDGDDPNWSEVASV